MPSRSAPSCRNVTRGICALLVLVTAAPRSFPKDLQTEGPWPGVTFSVGRVDRIDDHHAIILVGVSLARTASRVTVGTLPPPLSPGPGLPLQPQPPVPFPFSEATLEIDRKAYRLASPSPYANPDLFMVLQPGVQIGRWIEFDVPPPLPSDPSTGKRPPIPATLCLPQAKPIPGVRIPSETTLR